MTRFGYLIARLAQKIGIDFRKKRMCDAALELNLLREAEEVLGRRLWKEVSEIEDLSVEYWKLREHNNKYFTLVARLQDAEKASAEAHEKRSEILYGTTEASSEWIARREQAIRRSERLSARREEIVAAARDIRRRYEGNRIKVRILTEENPDAPQVLEASRRVKDLKNEFARLKEEREQLAREMAAADSELLEIENHLASGKDAQREQLAAVSGIIGRTNRDISSYKSQIGLLEGTMKELYCHIGRFVSRNYATDPACAQAGRNERDLIRIMEALRASMLRNETLSGRF